MKNIEKETWVCLDEDLIQLGDQVFIISIQSLKGYIGDYKYRVNIGKGQVVEFEIYCFKKDYINKKNYWTGILSVNKKGKGYEFGKETGKSGIKSLLIAKKILEFHIHKTISREYDSENIFIFWWDDNRRRDSYLRGLADLGFRIGNFYMKDFGSSGKCLYSRFSIKEKYV